MLTADDFCGKLIAVLKTLKKISVMTTIRSCYYLRNAV